jgi:ABC-type transporter Mla subunit MlaD
MYAALWSVLPGPVWVRVLILVVLVAVVLAACVFAVFPWLNTFVNVTDVTVEQ